MSINVTVSGNPVSIRRGKMVTACDPAKSEFEKRRLMRLEQVRQQSRDIAENIRNRLRKEKTKCLSEIEKEGEVKLKNWQARKLLELQNQYQEALDEIGLGHKEAARVESEEETFLEQQEVNDKIARERGRAAAERLQIEKNEDSLKKAVPIQRKKISRDVENSRSSAVASLRKIKQSRNSFKKKKKQQQTYDSDSENRVPQLFDLEKADPLSSASLEADNSRETSVHKTSKEQQTSGTYLKVPQSDKAAQTLPQEEIPVEMPENVLMDTRISERIKRRTRLNPLLDYCEFADKQLPLRSFNKPHCTCCQCLERKEVTEEAHTQSWEPSTKSHQLLKENEIAHRPIEPGQPMRSTHNQPLTESKATDVAQPVRDSAAKSHQPTKEPLVSKEPLRAPGTKPRIQRAEIPTKDLGEGPSVVKPKDSTVPKDIPSKPKVTLRSFKDRVPIVDPNSKLPVQYYDHPNRFSKQYIPSTSHVQMIDDDDLLVSPATSNEDEVLEKMRRRDVEAHVRGQAAMEKERILREYRELLKKLPALQKQERIYEIGTDKEKYHMSRDRLEETEKRRQNRLDNAYEEVFVRRKPATVTLPKRKPEEAAPSLNLANSNWDVDFEPTVSNASRTEQLNNLISNLKTQKDSLLREIEKTLSKETLDELTKSGHEDDVKSKSTDYPQTKTKRKRSRDERPPSPTSSDVVEQTESRPKSTKNGTPTSPSPRKKAKLKSKKKKVLVLQNSSTQTTPKTGYSVATSPVTEEVEPEKCTCPKGVLDDLCEIVIKIKEDDKPEVTVNPPAMEKAVKVVTEEKKMEESGEGAIEKDKSKESSIGRDISESRKSTGGSKKSVKSSSWKENLSRSISSQSTSTSTSYFELPNKHGGVLKTMRKPVQFEETLKSSTQSDDSKRFDPRLLTYIKRLLNMSRASIDDLTVSTVSEVSTPSESVVNTPTNNPLLQLKNVMRYFNLDFAELQKQLSYVSDDNSLHYNTSESVTVSSSSTSEAATKSFQLKSCTETVDSVEKKQPSNKLLEYADIAASCTKKISSLTAMIQKVREEKKKILQSPPTSSCSDKDISTTSYMGLPGTKKDDEASSSTASTQEDLDKRLLTIDLSYAERLKRLTDEEIQIEKKRAEAEEPRNEELLSKLKSLLQDDGKKSEEKKKEEKKEEEKKEDHPMLFLDIPKLPRLEAPSLEDEKTKKKRPPPSKGLRVLGGPVVAHELSTIVEADSQLSVRAESPVKEDSPKTSSKSSSSVPDILTEVPPHKETNSSDDVSEMETMLKSIGMEWAIPTLKKTREALALSSSSGSSGSKRDSGEVSLREFLSRISSSSSSTLSDSQGISLIQVDNRRTSTPILETVKKDGPVFLTDSDLSSVREQSNDASKTG